MLKFLPPIHRFFVGLMSSILIGGALGGFVAYLCSYQIETNVPYVHLAKVHLEEARQTLVTIPIPIRTEKNL